MSCKHERIKSVNCEIFCMDCNEKLPIDYLVGNGRIAAQKAAEPAEPEEPKKTTTRKKKA